MNIHNNNNIKTLILTYEVGISCEQTEHPIGLKKGHCLMEEEKKG